MNHTNFRKGEPPQVTDHAVLRYMERVLGIDVSALRAEILPPMRAKAVKTIGNGRLPLGNGLDLVIKGGQVITIAPRHHPGDPTGKKL